MLNGSWWSRCSRLRVRAGDRRNIHGGRWWMRFCTSCGPGVRGGSLWVPNIVPPGLISGFAALSGSPPARSLDGSAAVVLDRFARVRVDRAARPIASVEGRRDLGVTASARGSSSAGRCSPAIVGGPGDHFRVRAAATPAPSAPSVRHAADPPALARRPGEATLDLPQARTGTTTDRARDPGSGLAVGDRESDLGISPERSPVWAERFPRPPSGRS
jgi:hypothetical protein